jgi:hypothetical protein
MVLTWAVSLFLGGMFASWFDGRADQTVGSLHGVTVWGLAVAASGLLLAVGLTQFVQGGAALVKGGATVGAAAAGMAAPQMAQRGQSGPMDDAVTGLQDYSTRRADHRAQRAGSFARGSGFRLSCDRPGRQSRNHTASSRPGQRFRCPTCHRAIGPSNYGRRRQRAHEGQQR